LASRARSRPRLARKRMNAVVEKLEKMIGEGLGLASESRYDAWHRRVKEFLRHGLDSEAASRFEKFATPQTLWQEARDSQVGMLQGLALKLEHGSITAAAGAAATPTPATGAAATGASAVVAPTRVISALQDSNRVFVVHGRDEAAKESVARFLARLGLEPIILHEQASSGRTIIEKFEVYADVGFAVVLLTPDDVGGLAGSAADLKPRARQNVIMELGYFIGKLSRRRVCALYKNGVEIPSDYQGVIYVELDSAGAWRTKLAQELVEAGFSSIKLEALLN